MDDILEVKKMFEKKKFLVFALAMFLLGATAGAVAVGTIYTQEQLDLWTKEQVISKIEASVVNVYSTELLWIFELEIKILEKTTNPQTGISTFEVVYDEPLLVEFDRKKLKECVNDFNKTYCKMERIKPVVIATSDDHKNSTADNILSWQTPETDDFTIEDFTGLISDEELN